MPYSPDDSDKNNLPDPELNPLLNPLLAAHMGRWAEVYFTNPPEKRGQAIAELLRELESSPGAEPASAPTVASATVESVTVEPVTVESAQEEHAADTEEERTAAAEMEPQDRAAYDEPINRCPACAHHNMAGQRFCGMCGAPLQTDAKSDVHAVPDAARAVDATPVFAPTMNQPEPSFANHSVAYAAASAFPTSTIGEPREISGRMWPLQPAIPSFAVEPEPVPYRYRLYVGVVLVILVAVLIYMAWRGTKVFSSTGAPQPVAARTMPAAQPATPDSTPPADAAPPAENTPASAVRNPAPSPVARQVTNESGREASSRKQAAAEPAPKVVPVAANAAAALTESSGGEDFAMAERFLNGTAGTPRNSREAAQWLWKAVRKQNLAATLALSDLYLRGDGVEKNCDQARLLLDAAARKGGAGAGERLRNLQAFGCQ